MDTLKVMGNYFLQGEHPIELIKLLATILTAYFTVTWSLKRFLKEKKWEKKSEAYSRIMEALHHLKRIQLLYLDDELERTKIDEKKMAEINLQSKQARNEVEKYIDIGRYYISDEAIAALEKMHSVHEECVDEWNSGAAMLEELYKKELSAVKNCLDTIRAIAIKEVHK
ncbi:hypothetical protein ACO0LM_22295 [Undibacterium sp. Di26W]|uniref:hypothetical protein n=1 Tax=Undibacterium sp. Di26W TaxID=3413035 RepID=UPI003BF145B4